MLDDSGTDENDSGEDKKSKEVKSLVDKLTLIGRERKESESRGDSHPMEAKEMKDKMFHKLRQEAPEDNDVFVSDDDTDDEQMSCQSELTKFLTNDSRNGHSMNNQRLLQTPQNSDSASLRIEVRNSRDKLTFLHFQSLLRMGMTKYFTINDFVIFPRPK